MATDKVVTFLSAEVPPGRVDEFVEGFRKMLDGPIPDGMLNSELLYGESGTWIMHTTWRDRAALQAARKPVKPPTIALCERVGATFSGDLLAVEVEKEYAR